MDKLVGRQVRWETPDAVSMEDLAEVCKNQDQASRDARYSQYHMGMAGYPKVVLDAATPAGRPALGTPMSLDTLMGLHQDLCEEGRAIMQAKNQDYTAGGGSFDNFRNSEVFGVRGELGLLMRVMDKLMRMKSFLANGTLAVKDESVRDAVVDVINYMVLFYGMISETPPKGVK